MYFHPAEPFTEEWDFWSTDTLGSSGMPESDREHRGHRIRVSQKKSDEAVLVQQIQLLALKRGKTVPADQIREWISQLLE
jgi:hypothetical protein